MNNELMGKRVRVYRNLHTGTFSVQDAKTGLVIAHLDRIFIKDAAFVVRPAGRAKVLRDKKKNVHAFVVGYVSCDYCTPSREVSYNPYKAEHFYFKSSEEPVLASECVLLKDNKIFI